jgi:hypothetical protein
MIQAVVAYATSSTGIAANKSATPNGMPTTVTSATIASSGTPIAIATPNPIVAPRRSRTARSAAYSAPGASQTSRAPTITVETRDCQPPTEQAHPTPPVRCVGPILIADPAAHPRAAREHGGFVA